MFRVLSAIFLCFSRVYAGVERGKILGVLGGFSWFLPQHQGMEGRGYDRVCELQNPISGPYSCFSPSLHLLVVHLLTNLGLPGVLKSM